MRLTERYMRLRVLKPQKSLFSQFLRSRLEERNNKINHSNEFSISKMAAIVPQKEVIIRKTDVSE